MKVAHVLGRGIDGCGVTKAAIELQAAVGGEIFASKDKTFRGKSFDFKPTTYKTAKDWQDVAKRLNEFDLVILHSTPPSSMSDEIIDGFVDLVQAVTSRKALICHDHKMASITRNGRLVDICKNVDILTTHSLSNDFCRYMDKNGVTTPRVKMELGFDYDAHRAKYWKPIEQTQDHVIRWIGRAAGWKNPKLMIDFHESYLMERGFITVLEGLEASIGYKDLLYRDVDDPSTRRKVSNFFRPEKEYGEDKDFVYGEEKAGVGAYLYPPFVNSEAMERLSRSAFGSNLYNLGPQFHNNNIEYCHSETIASGTIPIFHQDFLDTVIHKKYGDPISKCVNTGTIGLSYDKMESAAQKIEFLAENPTARDEWREMAFAFWKDHNDIKEIAVSTINNLK